MKKDSYFKELDFSVQLAQSGYGYVHGVKKKTGTGQRMEKGYTRTVRGQGFMEVKKGEGRLHGKMNRCIRLEYG